MLAWQIDELTKGISPEPEGSQEIPAIYLPFLRTVLEVLFVPPSTSSKMLVRMHNLTSRIVNRMIAEIKHNYVARRIGFDLPETLAAACSVTESTAVDLNSHRATGFMPDRDVAKRPGWGEFKTEKLGCNMFGKLPSSPERF